MRGRTIRLVNAIGGALVGISAIGSVIAYSAVAWIAQECQEASCQLERRFMQ